MSNKTIDIVGIKAIHSLKQIFYTKSNETVVVGRDENGREITIVFNTIELLEMLDIYKMKEQAGKYINNLQ